MKNQIKIAFLIALIGEVLMIASIVNSFIIMKESIEMAVTSKLLWIGWAIVHLASFGVITTFSIAALKKRRR
ncbi:hypothetical protein [Phaeocystidibacter marisrubri]|uniref:Uncharacterized protein n=1 Tax=Phaeocystidibacter marisrubri TaxID=1577780 RepID=A0A6L3ZCS1_9FLAO|nr:hypothetical protein [Phaeocystidibacter marisrubri]KAB2815010.1 hypothetical protein F8C82_14605 [Phaeocystidibacter marisrubri]